MGKMEWMIAVLAAGLAAGVAWIRHRRQTGQDSYLPLWRPLVWLAGWLAILLGIIGIFFAGFADCTVCVAGGRLLVAHIAAFPPLAERTPPFRPDGA